MIISLLESKTFNLVNMLIERHIELASEQSAYDKSLSEIYHRVENGSEGDDPKAFIEEMRELLLSRRAVKEELYMLQSFLVKPMSTRPEGYPLIEVLKMVRASAKKFADNKIDFSEGCQE